MGGLVAEEQGTQLRYYIGDCLAAVRAGALLEGVSAAGVRGLCGVAAVGRGAAAPRADGDLSWLRQANEEADRAERRALAAHTMEAVECRNYILAGCKTVRLERVTACLDGTLLISPSSGSWPAKVESSAVPPEPEWASRRTSLEVARGVVFGVALDRVKAGRRVCAVSAASGYHVGGGFTTGGRHALEEAMCVQSTLYASLARWADTAQRLHIPAVPWARPETRYDESPWEAHLPDDGALLSPFVEVFREGTNLGYPFRDAVVQLEAVVSVAMPNCNDRMSDSPVDAHPEPAEYARQLERRWRAALVAAAHYTEADCLVVPDAGCGVFRNPPGQVGRAFGHVLREEFAGRFAEVVLAFPGGAAGEEFAAAAASAFEGVEPEPPPEPVVRSPVPNGRQGGGAARAATGSAGPIGAAATRSAGRGFRWEFGVSRGFEPFRDDCQDLIEAKWRTFRATGESAVSRIPCGGRAIIVDFGTMTQQVEGSTGRIREVRRTKLAS